MRKAQRQIVPQKTWSPYCGGPKQKPRPAHWPRNGIFETLPVETRYLAFRKPKCGILVEPSLRFKCFAFQMGTGPSIVYDEQSLPAARLLSAQEAYIVILSKINVKKSFEESVQRTPKAPTTPRTPSTSAPFSSRGIRGSHRRRLCTKSIPRARFFFRLPSQADVEDSAPVVDRLLGDMSTLRVCWLRNTFQRGPNHWQRHPR